MLRKQLNIYYDVVMFERFRGLTRGVVGAVYGVDPMQTTIS